VALSGLLGPGCSGGGTGEAGDAVPDDGTPGDGPFDEAAEGGPPPEPVRVSILVENTVSTTSPVADRLGAENGIAWLVEKGDTRVLVDAGLTDLFVANAAVMGVDLGAVDAVVISHVHLDHWTGLRHFLDANPTAKVHLHEDAEDYEYFYGEGYTGYHGIPDAFIERHRDRLEFFRHEEIKRVAGDVYVVSGFGGGFPRPQNVNLFRKRRGTDTWEVDDLRHDVAVLVARGRDLLVVSPCSHNGIVNVVDRVVRVYRDEICADPAIRERPVGEVPVRAVIGGFHFVDPISLMGPGEQVLVETPAYIGDVGAALAGDYAIVKVYTCHCTGHEGYGHLAGPLGAKLGYAATGDVLDL
jgi:7,8-dihydropterin-6-yl-methyl-4-(beta-D-ribofuranosyl)aminobenzene 5'-phosphate synthase